MSFTNFTNPYRDPADVPEEYRNHPAIARRFRPDGTYLNTLEDPVTLWAIDLLHKEYGVPLNAMEVEAVVKAIKHSLVTNQALAKIRIRETVDLLPDFLQAFLSSPAGQIQIGALKRPLA